MNFSCQEQVAIYDKNQTAAGSPRLNCCVSTTQCDRLVDRLLKRRPSTYQEITPIFISQLGAGWKKHESKPELSALFEDNLFDMTGLAKYPARYTLYLSSNSQDQRNLDKSDPVLIGEGRDRWYVP